MFVRLSQADMCRSHSAPSTRNWQKHVRLLRDEVMLLLRRKHKIAVSLALGGKGCKYPATYAKVRRAHMRTLLRALEAECNATEVIDRQTRVLLLASQTADQVLMLWIRCEK